MSLRVVLSPLICDIIICFQKTYWFHPFMTTVISLATTLILLDLSLSPGTSPFYRLWFKHVFPKSLFLPCTSHSIIQYLFQLFSITVSMHHIAFFILPSILPTTAYPNCSLFLFPNRSPFFVFFNSSFQFFTDNFCFVIRPSSSRLTIYWKLLYPFIEFGEKHWSRPTNAFFWQQWSLPITVAKTDTSILCSCFCSLNFQRSPFFEHARLSLPNTNISSHCSGLHQGTTLLASVQCDCYWTANTFLIIFTTCIHTFLSLFWTVSSSILHSGCLIFDFVSIKLWMMPLFLYHLHQKRFPGITDRMTLSRRPHTLSWA